MEARLDALDAAAVGLLEPLIAAMSFAADPSGTADTAGAGQGSANGGEPVYGIVPQDWRRELAQALEQLCQAAAALELSGLTQTARLLAVHLAEVAAQGGGSVSPDVTQEILHDHHAALELALAEGWVSDAIAFCSGQLASDDSANLVGRLRDWPGLGGQLSAERASALAMSLRADAHRIAQATRSSLPPATSPDVQPEPPAQPQPADPGPGTQAAIQAAIQARNGTESETPSLTIGADELQMLAEAARLLEDEFTDALAGGADPAAFSLIGDALERYGRALAHVGLTDVSRALSDWQQNIDALARQPEAFTATHRRLLAALAAQWEAVFSDPSAPRAQEAIAVLADVHWPQPLADAPALAARRMLSAMHVVGTRRVQAVGQPIDTDAWSLEIPEDADPSVVNHLLRELPLLSAAFSLAIERAHDGARDELAEAQRIAHTLKGAANTVGVRGIATLTHQLEDLLQLLEIDTAGDRPAALSTEAGEVLSRAADCLADMSDAVVEGGSAPAQLQDVHHAIGDWISRLAGGGERVTGADGTAATEIVTASPADAPAGSGVGADGGAGTAESGPVDGADTGRTPPAQVVDATEGAPGHRRQTDDGHLVPAARADDEIAESASDSGLREAHEAGQTEWLRVPASLIGRLLDLAGEASILLAQSQEQANEVDRVRTMLVGATDQLQDLSSELERLVDLRGSMLGERRTREDFDPLELDEHSDLQMVARRIAETGADARLIEGQFGAGLGTLSDLHARLERLQVDLRETALRTRTTTVGTAVPRWMRTVRQSARMAQREAVLRVFGEEAEIDAPLLQELVGPIGHLLRNAVDHGIEDPLVRESLGKPRQGSIELHFLRDGSDLVIECADDGAGLDFHAIRAQALALGLIDSADTPAEEMLARLVLLPEFSTRDQVTQLSGRGIGLDVVGQTLRGLHGTVTLTSDPGQGTRVSLRLPVRLLTLPVVIVRSAGHVLGLSVRGVAHIAEERDADMLALQRIVRLEDVLGLPEDSFVAPADGDAPARVVFEVCMPDDTRIGVRVPDPGQPRNLVVRSLAAVPPVIPGFEGAAVLGDGAVAPVYDLPRLLGQRVDGLAAPALHAGGARPPVCLVVDDSVSVRRMMEQFVRDLGCEAVSAGDGIEALDCARRQAPAIVLVDLEMPRMNGIDFVRALRAEEATETVPVVMITSRSSDKHRGAALAAGVDVFLTKPYTEDVLAAHIADLLQKGDSLAADVGWQ